MIHSLLDQDLYTLTVGQAAIELYPDAEASYRFTSRRPTPVQHPEKFISLLNNSIEAMSELRLGEEKEPLRKACPFIKPSYIGYLADYKFDPNQIKISYDANRPLDLKDNFDLDIAGPWHSTIFWEVPLLALISECYYKTDTNWNSLGQEEKIKSKGEKLSEAGAAFADFGTRRRRCYESQERVVRCLKEYKGFAGSSNVHLALKYGVKPIGTMSHQWIMGVSALESLRYANRFALHGWNKVYHGDLGIALTDTFGTDAFFEDFDNVLARLFDGLRHDSADPFIFARRVVNFYANMRIDYATKCIVFSDGLDAETAVALKKLCDELGIKCSFGIGTNFTNDYDNSPALNIVIKLRSVKKNAESRAVQVVKLSDVPTKATGDEDALAIAKNVFYGEPLCMNVAGPTAG